MSELQGIIIGIVPPPRPSSSSSSSSSLPSSSTAEVLIKKLQKEFHHRRRQQQGQPISTLDDDEEEDEENVDENVALYIHAYSIIEDRTDIDDDDGNDENGKKQGTPTFLLSIVSNIPSEDLSLQLQNFLNRDHKKEDNDKENDTFTDTNNNHNSDYDDDIFTCEVWATAPAPLPLYDHSNYQAKASFSNERKLDIIYSSTNENNYDNNDEDDNMGGNIQIQEEDKIRRRREPGETERYFEQVMEKWGMMIIPNTILFNNDCDKRDNVLKKLQIRAQEAIDTTNNLIMKHHPNINVGEDDFSFKEIASRSKQRFDLLLHVSSTSTKAANGYRITSEKKMLDDDNDDDTQEEKCNKDNNDEGQQQQQQPWDYILNHPTIQTLIETLLLPDDVDMDENFEMENGDNFDINSNNCDDDNNHNSKRQQEEGGDIKQQRRRKLMEKYVNWDISVVYSKPGAEIQGWHADGGHYGPDASFSLVSEYGKRTDDHDDGNKQDNNDDDDEETTTYKYKPYAICLFIPLIDLNETVGYTQFWPGSHNNAGLIGFGPVAEITQSTWPPPPPPPSSKQQCNDKKNNSDIDGKNCSNDQNYHHSSNYYCKAGDIVVYDYRLIHRGMPNYGTVRPIVQILVKQKWYIETKNYGSKSLYVQ